MTMPVFCILTYIFFHSAETTACAKAAVELKGEYVAQGRNFSDFFIFFCRFTHTVFQTGSGS